MDSDDPVRKTPKKEWLKYTESDQSETATSDDYSAKNGDKSGDVVGFVAAIVAALGAATKAMTSPVK